MPTVLRFDEFTLDASGGQLTRGGRVVPLENQPMLVLQRLATAAGSVVTRDELTTLIWGSETHVKFDDGLNYCVRQIRVALNDDPRAPRFVATIPRRGYRFVAAVAFAAVPARSVTKARTAWFGYILPLASVALAAVVVLIAESSPNNHHEIASSIARGFHEFVF